MTESPAAAADSARSPSGPGPIAWLNDRLVPLDQLVVPAWDLGFAQGVAVAEQLRTLRAVVWDPQPHLERLRRGLEIAGIDLPVPAERLAGLVELVAAENRRLVDPADDLSLFVTVTAGDGRIGSPAAWKGPSIELAGPRLLISAAPIAFDRWSTALERGLVLGHSQVRELDALSAPRELKSRSRMHYWLAEREVRQRDPEARPVLAGTDGLVADTSTGSLVVIDAQRRVALLPRTDQCLLGTSRESLLPLVEQAGLRVQREGIRPLAIDEASEILWFSTPVFALPVGRINGRSLPGWSGPVWKRFSQAAINRLGMDPWSQARRFVRRGG